MPKVIFDPRETNSSYILEIKELRKAEVRHSDTGSITQIEDRVENSGVTNYWTEKTYYKHLIQEFDYLNKNKLNKERIKNDLLFIEECSLTILNNFLNYLKSQGAIEKQKHIKIPKT